MIEALSHLFAAVCGQNLDHTWAPAGLLLPCCQRCTGLYVGAGMAALLHLWLRPKLSARFLEIHGAFLLFMAPYGFHWVAQGPALRTITGVLFGFAVVTFLRLPLASRFTFHVSRPAVWGYFLILGATVALLPLVASVGGQVAAFALSGIIACGALALLALVVANISLGLFAILRWARRLTSRRIAA
jgi:uncharacterized membrane protein